MKKAAKTKKNSQKLSLACPQKRSINVLQRLRRRFGLKLLSPVSRSSLGQSTTEYILILAVVVMIALKFKKTFDGQLKGIIQKLGQDIEKAADVEE